MAETKNFKYGELQKDLLAKVIRDLTNFKKSPRGRKVKAYASARLSKLEEDVLSAKSYNEAIIGGGMLDEGMKVEELKVVYEQINEIYLEYRAELVETIEKSSSIVATPPI